jgi:hypothetical protein
MTSKFTSSIIRGSVFEDWDSTTQRSLNVKLLKPMSNLCHPSLVPQGKKGGSKVRKSSLNEISKPLGECNYIINNTQCTNLRCGKTCIKEDLNYCEDHSLKNTHAQICVVGFLTLIQVMNIVLLSF